MQPYTDIDNLHIDITTTFLSPQERPAGELPSLMVHHSLVRDLPKLEVVVPSRLIYTTLNLRTNQQAPPIKIVAFYGSNTGRERAPFSRSLGGLLKDACTIGGHFNTTTLDGDSTCLTRIQETRKPRKDPHPHRPSPKTG